VAPKQQLSILLIDDMPDSAQSTTEILEADSCLVRAVSDGGQAHADLRMNHADFVITRIVLHGETGFEICERMKQTYNLIPVLILTEIDLDASRNLAQRLGADGYLVRPFRSETLVGLVREIHQAAKARARSEESDAEGHIRFRCRCGQKIKEKYAYRGKTTNCTACFEKVRVPQYSMSDFFSPRPETNYSKKKPAKFEPLDFLTVKCRECGVFFRLFQSRGGKSGMCPKCGSRPKGAMSIAGAPMARAALASTYRVLRIRSGRDRGRKLLLPDGEAVLGRDQGCHIRHCSVSLSGRHCTLQPMPLGLRVKKIDKDAHLAIDGEDVTDELLRPGSILEVGNLTFELVGNDRNEKDLEDMIQKWSVREAEAAKIGAKVYSEALSTAAEAAHVIQLHWEMKRRERAKQLESPSVDTV